VENAFKELGLTNFEDLFNQASQTSLFQDLEKGSITEDYFRNSIRKITGLNMSDDKLDYTWNQIIGDYPPHRIELLKNIQNNYKTYILSNTNSIHYRKYIQQFKEESRFDFVSLFSNTYWSFQFGKRKPDPDPFYHLLNTENIKPEETLFIDDSIQNIIVARKLNILAFHLTPNIDVTELFRDGYLLESKLFEHLK
jgi:putative hydrolase of the HAD superfamily